MAARQLVEGYRSVLKRIYSCEAYYERVKLYLSRTHPRPSATSDRSQSTRQRWLDQGQRARLRHVNCSAGSVWQATLERLEVSDVGGNTLSPLCRSGDDAGRDGLSLPGNDQQIVRDWRVCNSGRTHRSGCRLTIHTERCLRPTGNEPLSGWPPRA